MPENKNIAVQLNNYMLYLSDVKGCNINTLQAYKRDLKKFKIFTEIYNYIKLEQINKSVVEKYKKYLVESGLSTSTVSRSLSALRSMYQYFVANEIVEFNPAREVHNDKNEKKGPQILTNKEIEMLMAQPDLKDIKGLRDKAMLELLYASGIKVTELVSLDIDDVNLKIPFLKCGFGEKERFIPLYKVVVKALCDYVEKARKLFVVNPEEKALFVNVSGDRMTRQGFWKILKIYAETANIKGDITPHTLRHSFAAHLLENGADINDIKEILGHNDLSSTQRYAQFLKSKVKTSYMKFHPRA